MKAIANIAHRQAWMWQGSMESNRIARKPMDGGASSIRQEKQSKTVLQELCNCSLEGGNEKGEEQEQDGSKRGDLRVTDVDMDSLVLCASNLDLHDLVNMAMTCHRFRDAAYSDTVWEIQCRSAFFNIVSYTFWGCQKNTHMYRISALFGLLHFRIGPLVSTGSFI